MNHDSGTAALYGEEVRKVKRSIRTRTQVFTCLVAGRSSVSYASPTAKGRDGLL